MSGFEVRLELSKAKTFMNLNFSLLSICLTNKDQRGHIELIGQPTNSIIGSVSPLKDLSGSVSMGYMGMQMDRESEEPLYDAIINMLNCQEYFFVLFKAFVKHKPKLEPFLQKISTIILYDKFLNEEYLGLN